MNETTFTIMCGTLVFCFGMFAGCNLGAKSERDVAVGSGAAYWKCDPKTGKKEFVYRESEKP